MSQYHFPKKTRIENTYKRERANASHFTVEQSKIKPEIHFKSETMQEYRYHGV